MEGLVCPSCGSRWVTPIVYGLPAAEALEGDERGELELVGCMVEPGLPLHRCRECRWGFGSLEFSGDPR